MSRLTRDGTTEPVSRDQVLRHERGQGNIHFPCSADHELDWQPYRVDPYSVICDDHTYCIHTSRRTKIFAMLQVQWFLGSYWEYILSTTCFSFIFVDDCFVVFRDAQGLGRLHAGSRASFTSSKLPPRSISILQFSIFLHDEALINLVLLIKTN